MYMPKKLVNSKKIGFFLYLCGIFSYRDLNTQSQARSIAHKIKLPDDSQARSIAQKLKQPDDSQAQSIAQKLKLPDDSQAQSIAQKFKLPDDSQARSIAQKLIFITNHKIGRHKLIL